MDRIRAFRDKIERNDDRLVRQLPAQSLLSLEQLASLVLPHIETDEFAIHHMEQGRSGAGVLLISPPALVIKFGNEKAILTERENYSTHIRNHLPHTIVPSLTDTLGRSGNIASIAYSWASGNEPQRQLRRLVGFESVEFDLLFTALEEFLNQLSEWHFDTGLDIDKKNSVFGSWKWTNDKQRQKVMEALNVLPISATASAFSLMRDELHFAELIAPARKPLVGCCHGDVNSRNLLLSGFRQERLSVQLVDFGNVETHQCPARDWVKIERDLRLLCVRDMCTSADDLDERLRNLDEQLRTENVSRDRIGALANLILSVRNDYLVRYKHHSKRPNIDYGYYLTFISLAFLASEAFKQDEASFQKALVGSVARQCEDFISKTQLAVFHPEYERRAALKRSLYDQLSAAVEHLLPKIGQIYWMVGLILIFVMSILFFVWPSNHASGKKPIHVRLINTDASAYLGDVRLSCAPKCAVVREGGELVVTIEDSTNKGPITIYADTMPRIAQGVATTSMDNPQSIVTIVMRRVELWIRGVVTDEHGTPLPRVSLHLWSHPEEMTYSDESGRFSLFSHAVDGELIRLLATKQGYFQETEQFRTDTNSVDVPLRRNFRKAF
jgi:hypothetical protein